MSQAGNEGCIDYIEFPMQDVAEAKAFYAGVFGWTFRDYGEDYTCFENGKVTGGFRKDPEAPRGGPLVVIYGASLEEMEGKVTEHGGKIVRETFEFPGGRRFHFTDPSGNELAIWSDC